VPGNARSTTTGRTRRLTVAVTGPTGTFGFGLVPLLEADPRIGRIVGIARRPFDPADHGWTKMTYRRGDVRDPAALADAVAGADVVIHLAFLITGTASREVTREINVDGTLNTFRAAADAGARRFVYASSVAAYGFHPDNPVGMDETWPARSAERLFYAQEKAELENLLHEASAAAPDLGLYLLRPPIVLGPHALGAKDLLPAPVERAARGLAGLVARTPVRWPVPVPDVPVQFIHEDDVGQAFVLCAVGAGPPGTYNITGDGVVTGADVARELGLTPLPVPAGIVHRVARTASGLPRLPFVPPATEWVEALSHPSVMDASKAREVLGWRPRHTGLEALRATIHPEPAPDA
jgi:nucleoside-diphosphate-sugar epimerase